MPAESQFSVPPTSFWDDITVKSADESVVSSTALQNDNELFFPIIANLPYYFELFLLITGTGTADLKMDFLQSAGSLNRRWLQHIGLGPTTATIQAGQQADLSTVVVFAETSEFTVNRIIGFAQGTADATLNLRWAQNVSDAGATIVKAGSLIQYRKMVA